MLKESNKRKGSKDLEATILNIPAHEFLRRLLDTVQAIVLVLDTRGRIVVFNSNIEKITGYTSEEVKGKNWFDIFIPPGDRKRVKNVFINAIGDVQTRGNTNPILAKDGTLHEIEWFDNTLKDPSGNIVGIVAVGHDVSDRRMKEMEQRKNEALLSNALKVAHLGCWEYDLASDTFTFNDEFYALFHTTVEKVGSYKLTSEQYARRFLHPDDIYMVAEEIQGVLESEGHISSRYLEHRIIYDDGEVGYISVQSLAVTDDQGRIVKTYGANQDITEQKRVKYELEEQIKKSNALNERLTESLENIRKMYAELEVAKRKAEESDRLKSAFLANMSHEIRTPMNGIIGFSNMLTKPNLSEEKKKQYVEIINEMGRQLLNLINDIIDISMIETGQIKIRNTQVNVNDILLRLFNFYKPVAAKNSISLYLKKDLPDDQAGITCDATKFRQILDNLLSNALKFTQKGSIEIGYHAAENELIFFVKDTGIGIPPELQSTIFERFAQVELGAARCFGGTGLGLAITKAYVEKMGGRIWLESKADEGSVFYISMPWKRDPCLQADIPAKVESATPVNIPVILIVEDEEINYLFFEELLLNQPYKILHAKTGHEAVSMCNDSMKINLILMDIKLPDINGTEAMVRIKKIRPGLHVIAQTAYALAGDKEMALEAGFDDYISKPIDEAELLKKIEQHLNSASAASLTP